MRSVGIAMAMVSPVFQSRCRSATIKVNDDLRLYDDRSGRYGNWLRYDSVPDGGRVSECDDDITVVGADTDTSRMTPVPVCIEYDGMIPESGGKACMTLRNESACPGGESG